MSNHSASEDTASFTPPPDAPKWFVDNLQQPGLSRRCQVQGRDIHYLSWNPDDAALPVLILVHGFSGHAHWWSFLAPFFADRYRVLAIDLPGMGDSDPPCQYHDDCFAEAIIGFIEVLGLPPVTIIGHSFGGVQAIRAAALRPQAFIHTIVVDSLVGELAGIPKRLIDARGEHKTRPSRGDCIRRFRLTPPQPNAIDALVTYIGRHSCTAGAGGWHWKFDPALRNYGEINDRSWLGSIPVPVDCVYGELSMFNRDELPQKVVESFPNGRRLIIIPDAHHHLMADKPLELVASLDQLLDSPPE